MGRYLGTLSIDVWIAPFLLIALIQTQLSQLEQTSQQDGGITFTTLLALFFGTMVPLLPRVSGFIIKLLESINSYVDGLIEERAVKLDNYQKLSEIHSETLQTLQDQSKQLDQAIEVSLNAVKAATDAIKAKETTELLLKETAASYLALQGEKSVLEEKLNSESLLRATAESEKDQLILEVQRLKALLEGRGLGEIDEIPFINPNNP